MVFGGEAFGKWLDHASGACMIEISAFMKGTPMSSLVPSARLEHSEQDGHLMNQQVVLPEA